MRPEILNPYPQTPSLIGEFACRLSALSLILFCTAIFFEKINNTFGIVIPCLTVLILVAVINLRLYMNTQIRNERWKFFNSELGRGICCIIHLLVGLNTAIQTHNSRIIIGMLFSHQMLLAVAATAHICNHFRINLLRSILHWSDLTHELRDQNSLLLSVLQYAGVFAYIAEAIVLTFVCLRRAFENNTVAYEITIFVTQMIIMMIYFLLEHLAMQRSESAHYFPLVYRAFFKIGNAYLLLAIGTIGTQTLYAVQLLLITIIWIIGMIELSIIMKIWFKAQRTNNLEDQPNENPSQQSELAQYRERRSKWRIYLMERFSVLCLGIYGFFFSSFIMSKDCEAGLFHASWIALVVSYCVIAMPSATDDLEETINKLENKLGDFFRVYFIGLVVLNSCINKDTKYSDGSIFEKMVKVLGLIASQGFIVAGIMRLTALGRKKLAVLATEASQNLSQLTRAEIETNLIMKSISMAEVSTQGLLLTVLIIRFFLQREFLVFGALTSLWVLCNVALSFYWVNIDDFKTPLRRGLLALILALVFWPLRYRLESGTVESATSILLTRSNILLHQLVTVLLLLIACIWGWLHIKSTRSSSSIEFDRLESENVETDESEIATERTVPRTSSPSSGRERASRIIDINEPTAQTAQPNVENTNQDGREIIRRYYEKRNKRDRRLSRKSKKRAGTIPMEEESKAAEEEEKINELTNYFNALATLAKE